MKSFKNIYSCRCCKSKEIIIYLNLGLQPLANSYHKGNTKQEFFPLEVALCKNCFHSQLTITVNPEKLFKNYLYVSGTTKTFQRHCELLARDAVKRFTTKKLNVLDIACNDGTQLGYFRDLGCSVYGVDPAENLRTITEQKNIPVEVAYWNKAVAIKINKKFDIITGTNVFAHVNDLDEFLSATKIALKPSGLLILEFPYANKMVLYNEFDTVYHEHLSYFLVNSFTILCKRMGFYVEDVLESPIHGGSIRFFVKVGDKNNTPKIDLLIEQERLMHLLETKTYKEFTKRVKKNKSDMKLLLAKLIRQNYKIIGYGASAKGNTMLNYFNIDAEYVVDDNPLKWDYLTPGKNIPIKNPEILTQEKKKLAIIVLSWNFYNEIVKKIKILKKAYLLDKTILYVPTVRADPLTKSTTFSISG